MADFGLLYANERDGCKITDFDPHFVNFEAKYLSIFVILSRKVEDLLSLAKVAAGTLCNLGFVYHQNCSKSPKFLYKNKKILIQAVALNFGSPLEIERDGRKSTTRFGIFYTILGKQSWFLALPTAFWEINGGILLPTAFWEMDGGQFAPVAFIFLSTPPQIINFLAFWLQSWRKVGPGLWAAEARFRDWNATLRTSKP